MIVILDERAENGPDGRRVFQDPLSVIRAETAVAVPAALAAVEAALAAGRHVAGWLGYELGYALEPRLAPLMPPSTPLLCLGVFAGEGGAAPRPGRAYAGPLTPEWDAAAYGARFDRVKALIAAGDIYQANLSLRAHFAFAGDPFGLYTRLLAASGAGHAAYVDFFDEKMGCARQILSLSPELFFDLDADGRMTARPMKGTAPRRNDDEVERAALAASPKDRAENLMIVDLIRNDLGRIAQTGSVTVEKLFQVETYPALHTMISTVAARLKPDTGVAAILRALFPCGSVTGAPKIRAMEILRGLESGPRGAYCGAVGRFSPDGTARFNVAIRTLTISGGAGMMGLGGGVVQDSRGSDEYAECLLKGQFFVQDRPALELIETLKYDNGFVRLDQHLARMAASAPVFALAFDRDKARAALLRAVANRQEALRVRLALDEAGVHAATAAPLAHNPPLWRYRIAETRIAAASIFQRHKTSWRALYDREAAVPGFDEVLFLNEGGEVVEGARSNVFVMRDGVLLTPPPESGALPGILRAELIAQGKAREAVLTPADLEGEVYFGNSLRGLLRAGGA